MEQKENITFITCDGEAGMIIIDACEVEPKCSFCGIEVTAKNFGGIFSLPTRVCCQNICCLMEAMSDRNKL